MNEEEKKTIEELEEFIKGPCETCKYCEAAYKLNRKNIIQLLNLTKKIQKENEELNEKILDNAGIYQLGFKDGEESYIKKVKDKIKELIKEGRHYNANKIEVLQELLESEE